MPPRSLRTPPPTSKSGFHPPNDQATHRDLLIFEERLKTNAASLKRKKRRYQLFLAKLLIILVISALDFLFDTRLLISPLNAFLRYIPPPNGPCKPVTPHPYLAPGTLLIAGTTLFLFYASGMYSEKIALANKYVLHANRALRSFNMHLNVRPRPVSPLSYLLPGMFMSPPSSPLPPASPLNRRFSQEVSLSLSGITSQSRNPNRTATPLKPIPPPNNPRGELIFSSRVDRQLRDSYDRYRANFERRREEKLREANAGGYWSWFLMRKRSRSRYPKDGKDKDGNPEKPQGRGRSVRTPSTSRTNTPHGSRKPSPAGSTASTGSTRRRSANLETLLLESVPEKRSLMANLGRASTPTPTLKDGDGEETGASGSVNGSPTQAQMLRRVDRKRSESFSFLLGTPDMAIPQSEP